MLTEIDDLIRPDHWYLEVSDQCYFIGEYTAGRGYSHSDTNQLIYNLKKGMDRRGLVDWPYKGRAIRQASAKLRESLADEFLRTATFVPIPPSKELADPLYDNRMTQVLTFLGEGVDVRELIYQSEGMHDAHSAVARPRPEELYDNYMVNSDLAEPIPSIIAIVDDVLTTGAHFKAMQKILSETFPDAAIVGLFLVRRVPNTE